MTDRKTRRQRKAPIQVFADDDLTGAEAGAGIHTTVVVADDEAAPLSEPLVLFDEDDAAVVDVTEATLEPITSDGELRVFDEIPIDHGLETRYIPKQAVRSWALWDWSVGPFSTIIITWVFIPLYLASAVFLEPRVAELPINDPVRIRAMDDLAAGIGAWVTIAGIITALLIPLLGRRAGLPGHRKQRLAISNILLVLTMLALAFFVRPYYQFFVLGAVLIAFGLVLSAISSVSYSALLPSVSTPGNAARVSRYGWAAGYFGGLLALLIVSVLELTNWFGHNDLTGPGRFRYIALACALWALLFALPLYRYVTEPPDEQGADGRQRVGVVRSYTSVFSTLRNLFHDSPNTFWFIVASAIYRDGLAGIFTFGAIIAAITFGFSPQMVVLFGVIAYLITGIATILMGRLSGNQPFSYEGRVVRVNAELNTLRGAKRIIVISLAILLAAGLLALILHTLGAAIFWIFGLVLCAVIGPVQAASRAFLEQVTPPNHESEILGLYAITGKMAAVLSAGLWTIFIAAFGATIWGLLGILLVVAVGLAALMFLVSDGATPAET